MICSNCSTVNREQAVFCKECGRLLGGSCPNCGATLPEAAKYCDMCGHDLSSPLYARERRPGVSGQQTAPAAAAQPARSHLQQYVPRELLAKLATAQSTGGMVGERRIVTMLFCDVKDSTSTAEQLDPEEWSEIINGAFEHMIAPVYRYEGIVARLMGDGILAFFGAPIAHEDDAVRAILAGLEIVSGSEAYKRQIRMRHGIDIDVRVGINTGRVVVGAVGSDLRLEYTALGDAINVAARMEQTAEPGTVQIAEDTYKLVAPLFEFESLGGVSVKGKREPVTAYRVLGRSARPERLRGIGGLESPLIGRDEELAALTGALDELHGGRGRIIFLAGQAGLGKTRLVREMHAHWQANGPAPEALQFWIHRPVASYQASEAYRVIKSQIRLMYGIADGTTPEETTVILQENIKALPPELQPGAYETLARILGVFEEDQSSPPLDGETFKRQLFGAALTIIREQSNRLPAVLVLDDLHWADPASVELIQHLFQLVHTVPIVFLCIARPDRSAASWQLKKQASESYAGDYQETILQPLAEEESRAMLDGLLEGMIWPPKLRALILDKAEGNPFFIEEVVRTLIDSDMVRQNDDGQWYAAAKQDDFVVPGSLQALLAARIDRLPDEVRQVLQSASVIGRSFDYQVLQRINRERAELDRSLEVLVGADLIENEAGVNGQRAAGSRYRFRNALVQETVYRSILRRTRREYHRQVGEALLIALAGEQVDEQLPALAHHFYQAQDERAVSFNQRAGDLALALYANMEAAAYYEHAIEMAQHGATLAPGQLTELYRCRGRALELASLFSEAMANYREMVEAAGQSEDRTMELAALVAMGTIYSTANDLYDAAQAETLAEQALALAKDLGDEASEAKIQWNLLNMYRFSERPPLALAAGERSLELARKNNLREQLAYTANDLTHAYMSAGLPDKGRQTVNEAAGMWRELGNRAMLADSLATATLLSSSRGDFEETVALSDEAFNISAEIGNLWGQSYSRMAIGQLYWQRGEPEKALETMTECIRLGEQAGFLVAALYIGSSLALAYAYLGAFDRAYPLVRRALDESRSAMPYYEPIALSTLGQILLLDGKKEEATAVFGSPKTVHTYLEPMLDATVEEGKCRLLLANKEFEMAARSARNLVGVMREFDARILLPTGMHLHGQALMGSGQLEQARELLATARVDAERMGLQWPLWQILMTTADLAAAMGETEEADNDRKQAKQIFEGIAGRVPSAELRETFVGHPFWSGLGSLSG